MRLVIFNGKATLHHVLRSNHAPFVIIVHRGLCIGYDQPEIALSGTLLHNASEQVAVGNSDSLIAAAGGSMGDDTEETAVSDPVVDSAEAAENDEQMHF